MCIERISLARYLDLLGDHHLDHSDVSHAWFASDDACILGHVSLCPASQLWDAVVLVATGSGWAETEVDPGEFTALRSAESALVNYMVDLASHGSNCVDDPEVTHEGGVAHY